MKEKLTHLVVLLDRSGSMASSKKEVEKGFSEFFKKQKEQKGECKVSFYQFDDKFDVVYENKDIQDAPEPVLVPRGWTALNDALGKTINSVGEKLAALDESERPENVVLLIITDGEENSSKELTSEQVAEMVKHQTEKYNWMFYYIGCNQDAILNANQYNISAGTSLTFSNNKIGETYDILCSGISCVRNSSYIYCFSDQDRLSVI